MPGIRRINFADIVDAYLPFHEKGQRPSKYQLCREISRVVGFTVDPDLISDWGAVYGGIMAMRNAIWDDWDLRLFGTADRVDIIRSKLKFTPSFEKELSALTDDEIAQYGMAAEGYVTATSRGLKKLMENMGDELYEVPKEKVITRIDRLKRMACLWDRHLIEWAKNHRIVFLASRFGRGAGYGIPNLWQIINQRKKWFDWESIRIIKHMIQFAAVGGTTAGALMDARDTIEAIDYQTKVQMTMLDGPVPFKCPMLNCNRTFLSEEDLDTHMRVVHHAR